jgi:hypothetical protein
MRNIISAVVAALTVLVVSFSAFAQDSLAATVYADGRYIHDGPAAADVSNYSEVGAAYYHFLSGQGITAEGRYRIMDWPLSLGARYDWVTGDWTSRDRHHIGPSIQLKWGSPRVWDISLRLNLLVDINEGDMGAIELRVQYLRNFGNFQLIPLIQATFQGENELPEYSAPWEAQLTIQLEGSGYWRNWTYIRPLVSIENVNWWQFGGEHRGLLSLGGGAKGEWAATSFMTWWYRLSVEYRHYYGEGHREEQHGVAVLVTTGLAFH